MTIITIIGTTIKTTTSKPLQTNSLFASTNLLRLRRENHEEHHKHKHQAKADLKHQHWHDHKHK